MLKVRSPTETIIPLVITRVITKRVQTRVVPSTVMASLERSPHSLFPLIRAHGTLPCCMVGRGHSDRKELLQSFCELHRGQRTYI